jgi:urease accessory protein
MKPSLRKIPLRLPALFALLPLVAQAHPGHDGDHGGGLAWDFTGGFGHPMGGWDHLLAMVSIGLWAAQLGGRARWAVPASFVLALALGAGLGAGGHVFLGLEQGIAASVAVLGLLIVSSARLPLWAGMGVAAGFALFHGMAHGVEMPADASGLAFGTGFATATILLHLAGLGLGNLVSRAPSWVCRGAGLGLMTAGAWMLAS